MDTDARPASDHPGGLARVRLAAALDAVLLSEDEYAALSGAELDRYNEDRLDHHARLLVVATSTVRHTVTSGRRLILLNRHAVSARRGLIISGPAGTGKTIAITQLGLVHEFQDRARHPDVDDRIPVVYVTVPPAATPRMISAEFARFLGLPTTRRFNITDIIDSVVGVCTKARTGLVLVDELHNISLTIRHGAEVADTLKYFSERIAATFIYAGIDIEHSSLLSGTRGAQIAGRFTLIPTHPFPYGQEWKGLVSTMCSPACRQAAYRRRTNAARPPQIRAKNCQACEAPLLFGPTTKIYCSKRCVRWAYTTRRIDRGLPALPQPAADIPRGIQPDCCVVCGTPLTWSSTGQIRLTCSVASREVVYGFDLIRGFAPVSGWCPHR